MERADGRFTACRAAHTFGLYLSGSLLPARTAGRVIKRLASPCFISQPGVSRHFFIFRFISHKRPEGCRRKLKLLKANLHPSGTSRDGACVLLPKNNVYFIEGMSNGKTT